MHTRRGIKDRHVGHHRLQVPGVRGLSCEWRSLERRYCQRCEKSQKRGEGKSRVRGRGNGFLGSGGDQGGGQDEHQRVTYNAKRVRNEEESSPECFGG